MKKFIGGLLFSSLLFFSIQSVFAFEYGQVVRFQCERTGRYLSFDVNNDVSGEKEIVMSDVADDNGLWIIKGPITQPVTVSNPYDRWNCVLGDTVPPSGYEARIEHLVTAMDAYFGDYQPDLTAHVYPYNFKLGSDKLEDSSAQHYYSVVLNLNDTKKVLISNEYLCEVGTSEVALTQDSNPDTWNIIPVYTISEAQKDLEGQDLLNSLTGTTTDDPEAEISVANHLIEDVTGIIDFYNNEIAYQEVLKTAFEALAVETDINQRINIVDALAPQTADYNNQKITILGEISHLTISELINCVSDLLVENEALSRDLEDQNQLLINDNEALAGENQTLSDLNLTLSGENQTLSGENQTLNNEIATINSELSDSGATSVTDLKDKIDQLISKLNNLWG